MWRSGQYWGSRLQVNPASENLTQLACLQARWRIMYMYISIYLSLSLSIYIYIYIFEGFVPASDRLSAGSCWLVDCWNRSLVISQTETVEARGTIFGYLGTILVIQGPQGHPTNTRCTFSSILGCILGVFWDPLWRHVYHFCSDLGCQNGRQCPGPCSWWSRGGNTAWIQSLYVL